MKAVGHSRVQGSAVTGSVTVHSKVSFKAFPHIHPSDNVQLRERTNAPFRSSIQPQMYTVNGLASSFVTSGTCLFHNGGTRSCKVNSREDESQGSSVAALTFAVRHLEDKKENKMNKGNF